MKILLYFLFTVPLFRFEACVKENILCHKEILIENRSIDSIYIQSSVGDWEDGQFWLNAKSRLIAPSEGIVLKSPQRECWEHVFQDYYEMKSDTLFLQVLDAQNQPIYRYGLSLSDLRRDGFRLTHGNEQE